MKPRTTFLLGAAAIVGIAGYLMAGAITRTGVYYLTPQELAGRVAHDSTFVGIGVKVGARVVPGSIQRAAGGREVSFRVTDGGQSYPVVYRGIIPDTFADSADVILEGRLGRDGTFRATTLLAKCASRYENAPRPTDEKFRKYRATPGYRAVTTART